MFIKYWKYWRALFWCRIEEISSKTSTIAFKKRLRNHASSLLLAQMSNIKARHMTRYEIHFMDKNDYPKVDPGQALLLFVTNDNYFNNCVTENWHYDIGYCIDLDLDDKPIFIVNTKKGIIRHDCVMAWSRIAILPYRVE